jgi:hypothetical protein
MRRSGASVARPGRSRLKHYSIRTEQAYVAWIKRYILCHDKRHPKEMGGPEPGLSHRCRPSQEIQTVAYRADQERGGACPGPIVGHPASVGATALRQRAAAYGLT